MSLLRPTIAVWDYGRTRPLVDVRVMVEGRDPIWLHDMPVETMFSRALGGAEFDVSELSLSTFMTQTARGTNGYVGLPIFPSRCHSAGPGYLDRTSVRCAAAGGGQASQWAGSYP